MLTGSKSAGLCLKTMHLRTRSIWGRVHTFGQHEGASTLAKGHGDHSRYNLRKFYGLPTLPLQPTRPRKFSSSEGLASSSPPPAIPPFRPDAARNSYTSHSTMGNEMIRFRRTSKKFSHDQKWLASIYKTLFTIFATVSSKSSFGSSSNSFEVSLYSA